MGAADVILKLWEKGGVPLILLVGLYLIARFGAARFVGALDNNTKAQSESLTKIADAVTVSSAAQVMALSGLTERVSRMEGQVMTLGTMASGREPQPLSPPQQRRRQAARTDAVELFDGDDATPVHQQAPEPQAHPVPIKRSTPAQGTHAWHRPSTKGTGK